MSVLLFGFAVAFQLAKAKILKKSKTATIITPEYIGGVAGWLGRHGIKNTKSVTLYKRVSKDFKTQEGTSNETLWAVGSTLEIANYAPTLQECGEGKFHFCPQPYFADEFRSTKGDRYLAVKVATADLHAWEGSVNYPHKIAGRKAKVLYECDRFGKQLSTETK